MWVSQVDPPHKDEREGELAGTLSYRTAPILFCSVLHVSAGATIRQ